MVPSDANELLQYEGELVVVIGKQCKNVSEDEALDYVFGYTIGNDRQRAGVAAGRPHHVAGQEHRHLQAHGPLDRNRRRGPGGLRGADCPERQLHQQVQHVGAIFGVKHYISRMSRYLTLYPGDVIWMGTDGAPENMKDGDVINIEVDGIGTLSNPVVWEK